MRSNKEWKQGILCSNQQCSYGQWLVMTKYHHESCRFPAEIFSAARENEKRGIKPAILKSSTGVKQNSSHRNIDLPQDPSAPHAFTINMTSVPYKQRKNCVSQVRKSLNC